MTENISITRISDLPDSTTRTEKPDLGQNMYVPLNDHPNPYGIPPPNIDGIGLPQDTQSMKNTFLEESPQYSPDQHQRLPQRDIPMNVSKHLQDEEILPNYIPKPKLSNDYIREHELDTRERMKTYEERREHKDRLDTIIDELQTPLIIGLLYFIFQLPIVNTMIFKQFSFLQIYKEDGNFNIVGLILKSALFAILYVTYQKIISYISSFI
jgi:hypothetical protein